jgi:hypothetical protein
VANKYLKGTFVRNAWEFYEVGAAWVFGNYAAPAGSIGFIFRNNGIGQSYLDVFRAEFTCSVASALTWSIVGPGAQFTSIEPNNYFNRPLQLDLATPPGDMAVYTASPPYFLPIFKQRQDPISYDVIELANSGPFLTLPPLFGLAVAVNFSAPASMAMTVWYQSITDHVPQTN